MPGDLPTALRDCAGPGQWCPACDQGMGGRCALEPGHADSVVAADDCDEADACTCVVEWPLVAPCPACAPGEEDCDGGAADPDAFAADRQLSDGYEHDHTDEGYSAIFWMLRGGRPPADEGGDCDGTPEDANAGLGDFDAQACILGVPSFVQPHPRGPWNLMFDADAVNDCDGAGRAS